MTKIKLFVSLLAILFTLSGCKKDDLSSLSGTKWGTTIQQVNVLLTFSDNKSGVLTVSGGGVSETIRFTYTYNKPHAVLFPTDPPYSVDYPSGFNATVHGDVMDFSDFFEGEEVVLTKK